MSYVNINGLHCCGVKEIQGISGDPVDGIIRDVAGHRYYSGQRCAYYLFTDNRLEPTKGKELANFIEKNKLGTITIAPRARNPNSGNIITTFMWKVNELYFFEWAKKNHPTLISGIHKSAFESWINRYKSEYENLDSVPAVKPVRLVKRIRMEIKRIARTIYSNLCKRIESRP